MNLVLFLGAGFSAPFGQPVMNEFLGFADGCQRLDQGDRDLLGRLVLEARRANAFLESSATNIEDILSFSEMADRLGLPKEDSDRSDRLKRIIAKVYTTVKSSENYWSRYAVLESFLGIKLSQTEIRPSFITTNYDLNVESCLRHLRLGSSLGFAFQRVKDCQGGLYRPGPPGLSLYKLHGSANWYLPEDSQDVQVDDGVVRLDGFSAGERERQLPHACCPDYIAPSTPLIIPPSFLKPDLPAPLKAVWQGAARALSEAHVVVFVGYSFPPTDTEMRYFLAAALSENRALRKVIVVDKNARALVDFLRGPGSKMGSHFRDLLTPEEGNWLERRLGPLLGL